VKAIRRALRRRFYSWYNVGDFAITSCPAA